MLPMPIPEVGQDVGHRASDGAAELDQIEADLARARARVAASMHALGEEVSRRTDWRAWVRERPVWSLAGALALGFLLGRVSGPGASRGRF
jgi:hypothetical protein